MATIDLTDQRRALIDIYQSHRHNKIKHLFLGIKFTASDERSAVIFSNEALTAASDPLELVKVCHQELCDHIATLGSSHAERLQALGLDFRGESVRLEFHLPYLLGHQPLLSLLLSLLTGCKRVALTIKGSVYEQEGDWSQLAKALAQLPIVDLKFSGPVGHRCWINQAVSTALLQPSLEVLLLRPALYRPDWRPLALCTRLKSVIVEQADSRDDNTTALDHIAVPLQQLTIASNASSTSPITVPDRIITEHTVLNIKADKRPLVLPDDAPTMREVLAIAVPLHDLPYRLLRAKATVLAHNMDRTRTRALDVLNVVHVDGDIAVYLETAMFAGVQVARLQLCFHAPSEAVELLRFLDQTCRQLHTSFPDACFVLLNIVKESNHDITYYCFPETVPVLVLNSRNPLSTRHYGDIVRLLLRQQPDSQIRSHGLPLLPLIVAMGCLGIAVRDEVHAIILHHLLVNIYQTPIAAMETIHDYDEEDEHHYTGYNRNAYW